MAIFNESSVFLRKYVVGANPPGWWERGNLGPLNLDGAASPATGVSLPSNSDIFYMAEYNNGANKDAFWFIRFFPINTTPVAGDFTIYNSLVVPKATSGASGQTDLNRYRIKLGSAGLRCGQTAPWFYRVVRSGTGFSYPLVIFLTVSNKTDAADPEQQIRGDL
tara:strand:+ start:2924 stop:3415 length:492 start_codon:yes stop_codon:yes gene_type:complete